MQSPSTKRTFEPLRRFDVIPEESCSQVAKFPALIIRPKTAIVRSSESVVPLSKSILSKKISNILVADTAFFHGRRFRVGWSHSNTFTILSSVNALHINPHGLFDGRSQSDNSKAIIRQLKLASLNPIDGKSFEKSAVSHLQCQLKHSTRISVANSDCPQYIPKSETSILQDHLEVAQSNAASNDFETFSVTVWSLCVALWGHREELDGIKLDDHISIMLRRDLFSQWLENVVTEKDLLQKNVAESDYLSHLWKLLTANKVTEACDLAFEKNDVNLALLLAQVGSSKVVRALIAMQMESWKVTEADKFIAIERLKLMMLIGGISAMDTSNGELNVYENLDWLKAIAITIWYLASPTASITDALIKYDESKQVLATQPSPPYQNTFDLLNVDDDVQLQDIRYHILKLYSKRSHPMEKLLNPATHTSDILDYRLSWQLLQAFKALGYTHCSEQCEAHTHVSFASQLENYGLWHWSVFVLLHIQNQSKRELCIQELLYRYIDLSNDKQYTEKENFIVNELGIPEKWIYWAKAVRAAAQKNYHAQADYLLRAKQWPMAHEVIMMHIAPDAIINGKINSSELRSMKLS